MACGGCQKRQQALHEMMLAARNKQTQRAANMLGYVVKSGFRDARALISKPSLDRTRRR
jgi:hypothetical protein